MTAPAHVDIRTAGAADAEPIAMLHADSWRRHYRGAYSDRYLDGDIGAERLSVWSGRLAGPTTDRVTLVATEAALVVGFIHVVFDADPAFGALVDNLHVAHPARQSGIGTQLLAAAARRVLEQRPGSVMYLWVQEQNTEALAFYLSRKGEPAGQEPIAAPGGDRRNLVGSPAKIRMVWPDPATLTCQGNG